MNPVVCWLLMTDHSFHRVEHSADEAFRLSSDKIVGLFHAGAAALLEVMTVPAGVTPRDRRNISVAAEDLESLLVAWLNELIYLFETEGMLFSAFEITIEAGPELKATARGEPRDPRRHPIDAVVKAATFQDVAIREQGGRWETDIVFDV